MPAQLEPLPQIDPTAQLLIQVANRLTRLNGKVLGNMEIPLTFRQHRILARVSQGHTSLATLAAFGNLTLPTVSESVDVLVRRGLLTRRAHPDDHRAIVVELTPQGSTAVNAGQLALGEVAEELMHDLSEEARKYLNESLNTIYDAATAYFRDKLSDGVARKATDATAGRRGRSQGKGTSSR